MDKPYLPPLPGEDEGYRPGGRSIVEILTEQHTELDSIARELVATEQPARDRIDLMTAMLTRHLSSEEQYLHPALRSLLPDGAQVADREATHDQAQLRRLKQLAQAPADTSGYADILREVAEALHRHTEECDADLFPRLQEHAGTADLIRLGNRVEIAHEAAPSRPHPEAPIQAPANKVVAPILGAVDKVRDVVEGRQTYPPSTENTEGEGNAQDTAANAADGNRREPLD